MAVQVVTVENLGRGFVADAEAQQYHPVAYGDIKASLQTADHAGWYRLDGRAKTSLPTAAQAVATALGIGATLPNASNRVLREGTPGTTGGADAVTLSQAHLPAVTLITSLTGAHTHTALTAGGHTHPHNAPGGPSGVGLNPANTGGTVTATAFDATAGQQNVLDTPVGLIINAVAGHTHNSDSQGTHSHTVPLGGSGTPVATVPAWLGVRWFVYLG
jgi:hypothetical protein